jgi:hypothetical protein
MRVSFRPFAAHTGPEFGSTKLVKLSPIQRIVSLGVCQMQQLPDDCCVVPVELGRAFASSSV